MTKKANYNTVYSNVLDVISNYNLSTIPVSLDKIINNTKNLSTFKYSTFAEQCKCSVAEVVDYFGSDLGTYVSNKKRTKFVIYYNDTLNNKGLDRFTIAHELGHHFLNHSNYLIQDDSFVRGVSNSKYAELEKEANCFSRNLLSPIYLLHAIGIAPANIEGVKNVFCISTTAAKARSQLYGYDLRAKTSKGERLFVSQFHNNIKFYQHAYSCAICGCIFSIKGAHFCLICGSKNIELWGENKFMKYNGINITEKGKTVICPVCENEETNIEGDYCQICGTYIVNKCGTNTNYGTPFEEVDPCCDKSKQLPGNARYCPYCGSKTTFLENRLLKEWQNSKFPEPFNIDDFEELENADKKTQDFSEIDTDNNDLPF